MIGLNDFRSVLFYRFLFIIFNIFFNIYTYANKENKYIHRHEDICISACGSFVPNIRSFSQGVF